MHVGSECLCIADDLLRLTTPISQNGRFWTLSALRVVAHGLLPLLQGLDVIGQIEDALLNDIVVMWDQR